MNHPNDFINKIICGDCLEVMKQMPDKCVDLVVTDPPYGMNFQSNYRTVKYKKIVGDNRYPVEILEELFRLAKRAVYVFCRWDNLHEHGRQWEAICFYPQSEHEFIERIPDVIKCRRTENVYHPTQKPVGIIRRIIEANVGDVVLDPFLGSGTTACACREIRRDYIGIELDLEYCKIAENRLFNTQGSLF